MVWCRQDTIEISKKKNRFCWSVCTRSALVSAGLRETAPEDHCIIKRLKSIPWPSWRLIWRQNYLNIYHRAPWSPEKFCLEQFKSLGGTLSQDTLNLSEIELFFSLCRTQEEWLWLKLQIYAFQHDNLANFPGHPSSPSSEKMNHIMITKNDWNLVEKEIVREVARGDTLPEKIRRWQSPNQ